MPTITDATVVAQPYNTSGNGGRKVVLLDNGWVVAVTKTIGFYYFYVDKKDGNGFTQLCYIKQGNILSYSDISIVNKGNVIYTIESIYSDAIYSNFFDATTVNNVDVYALNRTLVDLNQSAMGNVSLAINEAKTELHATWASKNSSYPNSFNIRYAKGTINGDGTVTWSSVEQITTINGSGIDYKNPTLTVKNDNLPIVICDYSDSSSRMIISYRKVASSWGTTTVYNGVTYAQYSPCVISAPQSTNGFLANTWHGTDSTDTSTNYIRFSKSTDSGATWSPMQKLVAGTNASLTANKAGKLFITYEDVGVTKCIESTDNGENWGSPITIGTGTNPSTLFDLSTQISTPLTIYKGTSSVLFSGSWTTSSISPTQGDRGIITNRQSMMTYAITSDGPIGTVTEKINGVTVGTKTLTSGQNTTISITQAQWDNIKYGKYKDVNANRNTITIEAQGNTYTYTFDKEPTSSSDIISQAKAVKDSAEVSIPAEKKKLSDSINNLGGATTPTNTLSQLSTALSTLNVSKQKTGTAISSSAVKPFVNGAGTSNNSYYISLDISVIGFSPNIIFAWRNDKTVQYNATYFKDNYYSVGNNFANTSVVTNTTALNLQSEIFGDILTIPVSGGNANYSWIAIG